MADFPTLNRVMGDDRQPDTGLTSVIAPDGRHYGQSFYDQEFWLFNPIFVNLGAVDKTNLESFYKSNKLLAFDYTYAQLNGPPEQYTCYFVAPGIKILPVQTPQGQEVYQAQAWFRGSLAP